MTDLNRLQRLDARVLVLGWPVSVDVVLPSRRHSYAVRHEPGQARGRALAAANRQPEGLSAALSVGFGRGQSVAVILASGWDQPRALGAWHLGRFQQGQPVAERARLSWAWPLPCNVAYLFKHQQGQPVASGSEGNWKQGQPRQRRTLAPFWNVARSWVERDYLTAWPPRYQMDTNNLNLTLGAVSRALDGHYVNTSLGGEKVLRPPRPIRTGIRTGTNEATPLAKRWAIPWGPSGSKPVWGYTGGGYHQDDPVSLEPAPGLDNNEGYYQMNSLVVYASPGIPLAFDSFSLDLDIDTYAWAFSGSLSGAHQAARLEPQGEDPVQLDIYINGHRWVLFVESVSESFGLANERYTVKAASRTRFLGQDYAPRRSQLYDISYTAQQICSLAVNDAGFDIEWYADGVTEAMANWSLAAGSYGFSGYPIEAVRDLVNAAGGVIQPDPVADKLICRPRYPLAPWEWPDADPLAIRYNLAGNQVLEYSREPGSRVLIDRAMVAGTNDSGVAYEAVRAGTAGENLTDDVFHAAYQTVTACRAALRKTLCDSGPQDLVTIKTLLWPDGSAPGLMLPANLLALDYGEGNSRTATGLVLSCGIRVDGPASIYQSIKIEVH